MPIATVDEMRRILKSGGLIFSVVPSCKDIMLRPMITLV